jgi:hypothetical protein
LQQHQQLLELSLVGFQVHLLLPLLLLPLVLLQQLKFSHLRGAKSVHLGIAGTAAAAAAAAFTESASSHSKSLDNLVIIPFRQASFAQMSSRAALLLLLRCCCLQHCYNSMMHGLQLHDTFCLPLGC